MKVLLIFAVITVIIGLFLIAVLIESLIAFLKTLKWNAFIMVLISIICLFGDILLFLHLTKW